MKNRRYGAAAAVALAIGIAAGVGVATTRSVAGHAAAPDVAYTLLDGTPATLSQLRGKVVLVNFWATSCAVCVAEMPSLVAIHRKFGARGYETLAIAMRDDPPVLVMRYAERKQLPFRVAMDHSGSIARGFGNIDATPTSVLIDRRGRIVERFVGAPDIARLDARIASLLAES